MEDPTQAGKAFHQASKNHYIPNSTPLPVKNWPEEWKTVFYKSYPRFDTYTLPAVTQDNPLIAIVKARKSERDFAQRGLTTQILSDLLFCSCGKTSTEPEGSRRTYASGGGRYPIETYLILRTSLDATLKPGVYHYNVKDHTLEYLWAEKTTLPPLLHDAWTEKADAILVMTAVFARSSNKYHNNGYRFAYMDAGAILQNLYLFAAQIAGLKITGCRGSNDDVVEELLRLDGTEESLVCSALIGT